MRNIFLFMMISLDGYIEGPGHDLSWHNVDDEFNKFAALQMQDTDMILFGRRTYQLMEEFWPHYQPEDKENEIVREQMDTLPKVVVSRTLEKVVETPDWQHVRLVKDNVIEEVRKLKERDGGKIAVLGSNNLCLTLLEHNLLDELRLMVNPVIIGKGTPLFMGLREKVSCNLISTRVFGNGNVLLSYQPVKI